MKTLQRKKENKGAWLFYFLSTKEQLLDTFSHLYTLLYWYAEILPEFLIEISVRENRVYKQNM